MKDDITFKNFISELQSITDTFGKLNIDETLSETAKRISDSYEISEKLFLEKSAALSKLAAKAEKNGVDETVINMLKTEAEAFFTKALYFEEKKQNPYVDVKNVRKREALDFLSGRRGREVHNFGKSTESFGKALTDLGMKKLGGAFNKIGGSLTKFAGPIGIALQAFQLAVDVTAAAIEQSAKQQEFNNKRAEISHEKELEKLNLKGEELLAEQNNVITKSKKEISTYTQLATEGNQILQDAKASTTEIALQSMTDIVGGAFAAAKKSLDIETAANKFQMNVDTQKKILNAQKKLADAQLDIKKKNINESRNTANVKAETANASVNLEESQNKTQFAMNMVKMALPMVGVIDGLIAANQHMDKALLENLNNAKSFFANLSKNSVQIEGQLKEGSADFEEFTAETLANYTKSIYDAEQEAKNREETAWLNMTQTIFNSFLEVETSAYKMGRAFGFNKEQLVNYSKGLSQTQIEVAKFGKSMQDMQTLQMSYQENSGRNIMFSENDFTKSFANGVLIGDDVVSQLNAGMESFNKSVSDSNEMFYEMYKTSTKMGLSGRKYAKDLVNDLKLAEKYNFKGGVKSLMEMSAWAQNVRFNTGSLDSMLNKVQNGGLEGIIKQSAELQVLGGNFAMASDPLAMAYESFMDPEAYAKRISSMIAGQGVIDSKTGEVSFGIASQQIMRQYASSTGQDYKDVLAQAKQQAKADKIKSEVSQDFNDTQLAAIANKAQFNDGQWTVETTNGVKNVNELTTEDVDSFTSVQDPYDSIEENVSGLFSSQEAIKATQDEIKARLENTLWDDMANAAKDMANNVRDNFNETIATYEKNIKEKLDYTVNSQKVFLDNFRGSENDTLASVKKAISDAVAAVGGAVGTTNGKLDEILNAFNDYRNNGSDAELDEYVKHYNDQEWLNKSATEGTHEFEVMKKLYTNINETHQKVQNRTDLTETERKILPSLIARYDPNGGVTSAAVTHEVYNEIENNYKLIGKSILNKYNEAYGNYGIFSEGKTWLDKNKVENGSPYDQATAGHRSQFGDGLVYQNGSVAKIDSRDQVLAAKENGPLDRMLDMVQSRPMPYDSFVKETPYLTNSNNFNNNDGNSGELKIAPINITISGNLSINGSNVDLSSQIQNDPNFQSALWALISQEVSRKVGNTGKMVDPLYNRIQNI